MADNGKSNHTVIKKYANRRLYHTGTSTYVTLEDLATMVQNGEDFLVYDARSGDDITRSVLTQIIFEQENKAGDDNLLPVAFLRQLIRFYGDSMRTMVPSFLEFSMANFARDQEGLREKMTQSFAPTAFQSAMEEQVRANMSFFGDAMKMFTAFGTGPQVRRERPGSEHDVLEHDFAGRSRHGSRRPQAPNGGDAVAPRGFGQEVGALETPSTPAITPGFANSRFPCRQWRVVFRAASAGGKVDEPLTSTISVPRRRAGAGNGCHGAPRIRVGPRRRNAYAPGSRRDCRP